MKPIYLMAFFCLSIWSVRAQHALLPVESEIVDPSGKYVLLNSGFDGCAFDLLRLKMSDEERKKQQSYEKAWQHLAKAKTATQKLVSSPPYVLPVVVHVIHQNGAENISDAQVQQAIQHLNDAFANVGYYDPTTGVTVPISFCLAIQDPDGSPTTGINHLVSPLTDVNMSTQDLALKDLIRWDPHHYINIWVVREICSDSGLGCGVAGYAYYPSAHGSSVDGIVVEAAYTGSSEAYSVVLVHEMGHYLGLYHTFEGGCINNDCTTDGDRICDTPPDNSTVPVPCGTDVNSCSTDTDSGFATDQNDLYIDYMDYSNYSCYSAFTQGQSDRMVFTVEGVRSSLLESEACQMPCLNALTADFTPNSDQSIATGTTLNFTYTGSGATNFNWYVNGISFGLSANASYTFMTEGTYTVELQVGNSDPNCQESMSIVVEVKCPVIADFGASSTDVLPGTVVYFTNYSQNAVSYSWLLDGAVVGTATSFNYTFNVNGTYEVQLIASDGVCTDTSALQIITVSNSGIAGTGLPVWPMVELNTSFTHGINWMQQPPETFSIVNGNNDINGASTGAAFSPCGGLVFFVAHTGSNQPNNLFIYAPDGTVLLNNSTSNGPGLNAARGPQELEVVRVPGYSNEWYIIYDEWSSDASAPNNNAAYNANRVAYSRVRYQNGSLTVLEKDVLLTDAGGAAWTYNDGKAVSRTVGGDPSAHYLYLARRAINQASLSLDRFRIESTGIYWDANTGTVPAVYYNLTHSGSYIELSPTEDKIAVVNRNVSYGAQDVFIFDAAAFSNTSVQVVTGDDLVLVADGTANDQSAMLPYSASVSSVAADASLNLGFLNNFSRKLSRLEFSPNGRFLYVLGGGYAESGFTNLTYLAQIDLESSPMEVRLQVQSPPGGSYNPNTGQGCPIQQCLEISRSIVDIQTSYDGKLYFTKRNDNVLYVIPDPNNVMPQNLVPSDIDLSTPLVPNIQLVGSATILPDQIDGFNYLSGAFQNVEWIVSGVDCGGNCRAPFTLELWDTDSLVQVFVVDECSDTLTFCADTAQVYRFIDPVIGVIYDSSIVYGQVQYPDGQGTFVFDDLEGCIELCSNGLDDDGDGLIDCEDPDLQDSCCCYVAPVLDAGPDQAICENAVVQLQASGGFEAYIWSDLVTQGPIFTAYGPGVYWVQAQDICGQWHIDTVEVTLLSSVALDLGPDVVVCLGETVVFDAGIGFDNYEWIPDTGLSCGDCPNPTLNLPMDTSFILVASTDAGCYSTDTIRVEFLDTQLVYLDTMVCQGGVITYEGQQLMPGSVTPFVFVGSNGCDSTVVVSVQEGMGQGFFQQIDTVACLGGAIVYEGQLVEAGDTLWLNYQTVEGCDSSILVNVLAILPDTTEEMLQICSGDSVLINGTWVFDEGSYVENLQGTGGCDSVHIIHLSFFEEMQLGVSVQGSCPGQDNGSIEVTVFGGSPPYTYVWNSGLSGAKITDLAPGTYTVTVTDANGCQSVLGATFEEYPPIGYDWVWQDVSCYAAADGWISVQPSDEGLTYSLNGGSFQSDTLFAGLSGGEYVLTIRDVNGCMYEEEVFLTEPPAIVLSLPEELVIDLGDHVQLDGEITGHDTVMYNWTPSVGLDCTSCSQVTAQPLETTLYQLEVTTSDGCMETASTLIKVLLKYAVYIPNVFSPNGDGVNDKFVVYAGPAVESVEMLRIFDRWGSFIYEQTNFKPNDPAFGWDGTYRGQLVNPGVYAFYAVLRFIDGKEQIYSGEVYLVR